MSSSKNDSDNAAPSSAAAGGHGGSIVTAGRETEASAVRVDAEKEEVVVKVGMVGDAQIGDFGLLEATCFHWHKK
jgi:hypothetical protein